MLAQSTRPKCKADTCYLPMPDGVYLRGNSSRLILKGKSLYPLLEHLIPHLNGDLTLAELTADLDAEQKRMVMHLIEKLFAHQFLRDASLDESHALEPAMLETFAADIAFIDSFQPSAPARFALFRNQRLLLFASENALAALVQASLQCGIHKLRALAPQTETQNSLRQAEEASTDTISISQARQEDESELRELLQDCDAVLSLVEAPMVESALLLNRLCLEEGKVLMQAVVSPERVWLGPLVTPEGENCWECAWRRLETNMSVARTDEKEERQASHSGHGEIEKIARQTALAEAELDLVANRLLFALFQHVAQTSPADIAGKLSALDLTAYESVVHNFLPHPLCSVHRHPKASTASAFLAQLHQAQQRQPADLEQRLEGIAACVDQETGLLNALDAGDFAQMPLIVYRAQFASPVSSTQNAGEICSVIAAGLDTRTTLKRAAQLACARYALSLADSCRLLSVEEAEQTSCPKLTSEQLLSDKSALPLENLWSWAVHMHTQEAVLVPAAHVFATLAEQQRGLGFGDTWEEALGQGLLDWCQTLTVAQAQEASRAYPQLDLANMALTPEAEHLYSLLNVSGGQVTAYDLTGELGVPTFAFCLNGRTVAYSSACTTAQAAQFGLQQTLQQFQAEHFQQPEYALEEAEDLPLHLRSAEMRLPEFTAPVAWSERLIWLLEKLRTCGWEAYAVPLDHDPAVTKAVPFIARVLLGKAMSKRGE